MVTWVKTKINLKIRNSKLIALHITFSWAVVCQNKSEHFSIQSSVYFNPFSVSNSNDEYMIAELNANLKPMVSSHLTEEFLDEAFSLIAHH